MMESFISLHNKGYDIIDIAKMFDLSYSTVYKRLGEIAKKAGVAREELLKKPIEADHSGRNFTPVKPVDRAKFNESFATLMAGVDALQSEIAKTIEDIEITNQVLEEEMK
ncbi:hypothetical protein IKG33_02245 [Candidatus Saccharibacteria bacterium]|nr:hypothetical protein [Candidatus Saccharibacteria bacterium]